MTTRKQAYRGSWIYNRGGTLAHMARQPKPTDAFGRTACGTRWGQFVRLEQAPDGMRRCAICQRLVDRHSLEEIEAMTGSQLAEAKRP